MNTDNGNEKQSQHSTGRRLLPWAVVIGVLGIMLLAAMPGAWALPSQSPDFQTVPTITPTPTRPGPTNTPRPGQPTDTPAPGQPTDTPAPGQATDTPAPGVTPVASLTITATQPAGGAVPVLPANCWAVPTPGFAPQLVSGISFTVESDQFLVVPGQQTTLRYIVVNQGNSDLSGLLVCAPLEPFLERGAVTASDGEAQLVADGLVFELATLAAGASAQVELQLAIPADAPLGSVIENQAWLFAEGIQASTDLLSWALPPAYLPPTGHQAFSCGDR